MVPDYFKHDDLFLSKKIGNSVTKIEQLTTRYALIIHSVYGHI